MATGNGGSDDDTIDKGSGNGSIIAKGGNDSVDSGSGRIRHGTRKRGRIAQPDGR